MATTTAQPRSQTPILIAATAIGTIFLAFGLNAMFRPASAMGMFPLPYSSSSETSELIDALMVVYGARDVFMGLAIYVAAAFGGRDGGGRKGLGWVLLAAGAVAGVDGWVIRGWEQGRVGGGGGGEWNHWGYAPFVGALGVWLAMER